MKIGIFTGTYLPSINGVSLTLDKLVTELENRGHEVFVSTPRKPEVEYKKNFMPLNTLPIPKFIEEKILLDDKMPFNFEAQAYAFFKDNEVDLIHSHETGVIGPIAAKVSKKLNIPHIHTYHTYAEAYLRPLKILGYHKYIRYITRKVCNSANFVISPSKKISLYLSKIGVQSEVVTLINPPYNDLLRPSVGKDQVLSSSLGINQGDIVFVTFSRIVKEKGIDNLILILKEVLKSSNTKLLIAGFGPEIDNLKKLSEHYDIQDKVIFYGKYSRDELSKICSLGDIYVTASVSETQGIVILEAISAGLPVIALKDDAFSDFVIDNFNGYMCNSKDEFEKSAKELVTNSTKRDTFAKNSNKLSKSFSSDKVIDSIVEIYKRSIS